MTDKQPTALRLAQQLVLDADDFEDNVADGVYAVGDAADCAAPRLREAAMELMRLHEINAELVEALELTMPIECVMVHHERKHLHSFEEECPVVTKVYAALAKAQGEKND